MTEPLLEVENLHIHFETYGGTAKVINGVDFTIDQGETIALVGETGCGKSVTAQSILGLLTSPPARIPEGEIRYKGQNLLSMTETERHSFRGSEISMIMQDPMTALNPVYTIGEQMLDVMKWRGKRRLSVTEWLRDKLQSDENLKLEAIKMLEEVQISAPERVFDSYPVELSGGMRQRVIIAMALIADPDLLIADEPGTAIDVTTEAKILGLLDDLVEQTGTGVLYITHDLGVALEMSQHINVMYAGEIVEQAPTEELFDAPQHPYTRGLLESVPKLSTGIGEGMPGQIPDYEDPPTGCRFAPRCPYAEEECREVYPYRRTTNEDHSVACHLYNGQPTESRHKQLADTEDVDIGAPPWFTEEEYTSEENKKA